MMLQLNPPIWCACPLGEGFALMVIDYGPHLNSVWVIQLFDTGAVTHVDAAEVRIMGNPMYGIADPKLPVEREF